MFRQIWLITSANLKAIPQRLGPAIVMAIGVGTTVGVLTALMAMASGLANTLIRTGNPDRVVVMSKGAGYESASVLDQDHVLALAQAPGVARIRDGIPALSRDVIANVDLEARTGVLSGVIVRGISPEGLTIRPEIKLARGRMMRSGLHEVIIGRATQLQFDGVEVGDRVHLDDNRWLIVGVFTSGDMHESGFITDADTLLSGRTVVNSVVVKLDHSDAFDTLSDALMDHAALAFEVVRESDYYLRLSGRMSMLGDIADVVGSIMALGALFCTLNVMYSAVSARDVEIATLRAIGFGAPGILASVVIESLLIAVAGAALGAGVAWAVFNGDVTTMGFGSSSITYQFEIKYDVLSTAMLWSCVIGFFGALFPAIRAVRTPITSVLRPL